LERPGPAGIIALDLAFPFEANQAPAGALAFTEIAQVQWTIKCFPDPFRFGHLRTSKDT
jgi:hypothetical protein